MKLLITGICGFVGNSLARYLRADSPDWEIHGLDNFIRPGSERNRLELKRLGINVRHGDLRAASDFETLPPVDAVIDADRTPPPAPPPWPRAQPATGKFPRQRLDQAVQLPSNNIIRSFCKHSKRAMSISLNCRAAE